MPFLKLSDKARLASYREHEAQPEPTPAADAAQAVALESGRGRLVVVGDAAMLTSVLVRAGGVTTRFGMGRAGCDNKQLALNIMHWLSRRGE